MLERKDQQLTAQRAGLIRLQTLHQSVESNHYIVIHHLGQQIIQTARLVSTLWPEKEDITHELPGGKKDKLSEWILNIDGLSTWTINKLVKVSVGKRWVERDYPLPSLKIRNVRYLSKKKEKIVIISGKIKKNIDTMQK